MLIIGSINVLNKFAHCLSTVKNPAQLFVIEFIVMRLMCYYI